MSQTVRYREVPADPERVIEGLRDTGYQFESAIADIIDNSIAADATQIDLNIDMDFDGEVTLTIADNGIGMNEDTLMDAMRYGSPERPNPASLGKFGLGLKTASTAFCRRLSVVSRDSASCPAVKATWDLDHVACVGKWELAIADPMPSEIALLNDISPTSSGTVVIWEKIDRLLRSYSAPGGSHAQKALTKYVRSLRGHVATVYQRFLDPAFEKVSNVSIKINGEPVGPWDPFSKGESQVVAMEEDMLVDLDDGRQAKLSVTAYVLPRGEDFSSPEAHKNAQLSNDNQGIYVYRENRLVHGPNWLGMWRSEPHGTLCRVDFSFDHLLDDAFHIDIKKSQILLNEDLYIWLREFLTAPRRAADQAYRLGQRKQSNEASKSAHDSSNSNIHAKAADLRTADTNVVNADKNEVDVTNKHGKIRLKIRVSKPNKPGELHVQPVESIIDGLLWEPAIIETNQAVSINTSHPYYQKVYLPNRLSGVTVQGLDSMLWALCAAELGTISETTKKHFEELRYEVSRLLRALVNDLPDPDLQGGNDN